MAARTPKSESSSISRIASRAAKDGLQRRSMSGGGEVFSGDLASRALKSLGARAMTVDRSIIVSDDFDPNKAEDQALYAHEQYHLEHSGGEGFNHGRDGEEIAARQVERMVLHRAKAGGVESHEATQTQAGGFGTGNGQNPAEMRGRAEGQREAERGYWDLRAQGLSHEAIVQKLAEETIRTMDRARDTKNDRWGDKKGWM